MTEHQLSDPVLGPPSARSPWSATLCWSPEQNFGRVSLLTGRTTIGTLWGRLEAGESPEEVAKNFGLQVSAVHVVDRLRRDVAEQLVESGLQDAVEALASTVSGSPRAVVDQYPGLSHAIDRVTRFAVPPVDVYAVPDVLPDYGPSSAPAEVAVSSPADLVRAEHVSGVGVEAGPSSPLRSPGPQPVRYGERPWRVMNDWDTIIGTFHTRGEAEHWRGRSRVANHPNAYVEPTWAPPRTATGAADRVLPTTREGLAEFFGPIRLPNGATATGIFVQAAVDAIRAENAGANPKVKIDRVMEEPTAPDWGGEETDEGTPIYSMAWDSEDVREAGLSDVRMWVGPYSGGLDDGWAVTVSAPEVDVVLRCTADQLIEWADCVRSAIVNSRRDAGREVDAEAEASRSGS